MESEASKDELVGDAGTSQQSLWLNFYEYAWKQRKDLIKKFLDEFGGDVFKAIEKLKRFEGTHELKNVIGYVKKEATIHDYPTSAPHFSKSVYREGFYYKPFYAHPNDFILDFCDQNPVDAIVELGAGYSQNLVEIYSKGGPQGIPYMGGEITESGRQLSADLAAKYQGMDLRSFYFDHKSPKFPAELGLNKFNRIFLFTCHSIEQVQRISPEYFKTLAELSPNLVACHFEPFGWQIEEEGVPYGVVSKTQEDFFRGRNWNENFAEALYAAQDLGYIEITYLKKNVMSIDLGNPTSIAIWKPKLNRRAEV
mgnify:CR=1 FL=1